MATLQHDFYLNVITLDKDRAAALLQVILSALLTTEELIVNYGVDAVDDFTMKHLYKLFPVLDRLDVNWRTYYMIGLDATDLV